MHNNINKSFKHNIIGISTIIITAIIPIIAMATYVSSVNLVKSKVNQISTEMLEQLESYIDSELMEQERLAITVIENSIIQDLLLNHDKYNLLELQDYLKVASKAFTDIVLLGNVESIYVLNSSKDLVATNDGFAKYIDFKNEYLYFFSYADNNEGRFVWMEPSRGISDDKEDVGKEGNLTLIKTIKSKIDNQKLGYVIFTFCDNFLKNLYSNRDTNIHDVFIISNSGNIISINNSNTNINNYNSFIRKIMTIDNNKPDVNLNNRVIKFEVNNTQISFITIQHTGWRIVLHTDYNDDLANMRKIRNLVLEASGLLIIFFMIINLNGLSLIINPLYKLIERFIPNSKENSDKAKYGYYGKRKTILHAQQRISFKKMLAANFTIVFILPVVMLIIFEFSLFNKIIKSKVIDSYSYNLEQTAIQVDSKLKRIENSLKNFYMNPDILTMMKSNKSRGRDEYTELTKVPAQIIKEEQAINPDIVYLNVFDRDFNLIYSTSTSQQYFPKGLVDRSISIKDGETVYYGPYTDIFNRKVISIGKRIRTVLYLETAGFIHAVIDATQLMDSIASKIRGTDIYIFSKNGDVFISSSDGINYDHLLDENFLKSQKGILDNIMTNNTIIFNRLKTNNWVITIQISDYLLRQEIWKTLLSNNYILIIYIIFLLLIIFMLVEKFYTPISILNRCVKDVMNRLNAKPKSENLQWGKNEIGQLGQTLEYMESEIHKKAGELYETEVLKKATELYALQVEINPHFLFNTLETIRWKAIAQQNGDNEISEMIYRLSEFLRMTLRNKESLITVEEEIKYAKAFCNILKFSYEDDLDIFFNVDNEVYEYRTIKMILQPLIENSVVHGFKSKTGKFIIVISVKISDGKIIYEVKDNGVGIDKIRLDEIKSMQFLNCKNGRTSIGLKNISERILMNYGEGYGIRIESELGIGTTVRVAIPCKDFI